MDLRNQIYFVTEGRGAAEQKHRSIANMVEVMSRDYCRRNCVTIPELGDLDRLQKPATGSK
ncbi:MAG: hypothetical protein ACYC05_03305 [Sulfuricella sp.]